MQKHLYILLFALLSFARTQAQGWERIYGGSGQDVSRSVAASPDGGYVLTGYYNGNARLYLLKVDADGRLQWSKTFTGALPGSRMEGFGIVTTLDKGIAVAGYIDSDGPGPLKRDIYLLKTDAFGNKQWEKTFGGSFDDEARALTQLSDGCFVMTGFQSLAGGKENVFILKTDQEGNTLWFNNFGSSADRKKGVALTITPNGDVAVAGEYKASTSSPKDAYVLRVGASGNLIQERTYKFEDAGQTGDDEARAIVATADGNLIIAGFSTIGQGGLGTLVKIDAALSPDPVWVKLFPDNNFNGLAKENSSGNLLATGFRDLGSAGILVDLNILKLTPNGDPIWEAIVGRGGLDGGYAVLPAKGGGAIAAGFSEPYISPTGESYAYLVRTDGKGVVFTSYIQANVFRDFNNNCLQDNGEPGLKNWIVRVESQYDTIFTVANNDGNFHVEVDTGAYNVVLFPPNTYWKSCDPSIQVSVPSFYDTVSLKIPVRTLFDCPRNEIDISNPILRRCTENTYTVRYCNSGTVPSLNTRIEVVLDPKLNYVSSSIPVFNQSGDTLTFGIGTLDNGDCKSFTINTFLDCDETQDGQTHCVTAYISPRNFCDTTITSGWDGAVIAAKAFCENDSVKMLLQNVGLSTMNGSLGYVIAEDVIMLTQPGDPNFRFSNLEPGEDTIVWTHPANGSTYRIIAEQSPGYPGLSYPTAAVEGCLSDTSTSEISLGFYTMFAEDDADPFKETDCQESQRSDYNPVHLKRGHPKGYDDAHHYVSPQTDLDFLIHFRNTGADTVQQVIIRDTLSAALDPATVYPGAASHPYSFEVYGNGIVQFTLENVHLLPDGGASEGFVKFRVAQKPNIPCETIIFNSAAIYYDFGEPDMTNTTFHTICPFDSFVIVTNTKDIYLPGAEIHTYPNPSAGNVQFEVTGVDAQVYTLQLYDIQGRLIDNLFYHHPTFQLFRRQLPAGEIIYRLAADGKPVASGKLIVR